MCQKSTFDCRGGDNTMHLKTFDEYAACLAAPDAAPPGLGQREGADRDAVILRLDLACEAGDFQRARAIVLDEMTALDNLEQALQIACKYRSLELFIAVSTAFFDGPSIDCGLALAAAVCPPPPGVREAGNVRRQMIVMITTRTENESYVTALRSAIQHKDYISVHQILRAIPQNYKATSRQFRDWCCDAAGRSGDTEAYHSVKAILDGNFTRSDYRCVWLGACKERHFNLMREVVADAEAAASEEVPGVPPGKDDYRELFYHVCESGNIEEIRMFIRTIEDRGWTVPWQNLLLASARQSDVGFVRWALDTIPPEARSDKWATVIEDSFRQPNLEVSKLLIEASGSAEFDPSNALEYAMLIESPPETIAFLTQRGARLTAIGAAVRGGKAVPAYLETDLLGPAAPRECHLSLLPSMAMYGRPWAFNRIADFLGRESIPRDVLAECLERAAGAPPDRYSRDIIEAIVAIHLPVGKIQELLGEERHRVRPRALRLLETILAKFQN